MRALLIPPPAMAEFSIRIAVRGGGDKVNVSDTSYMIYICVYISIYVSICVCKIIYLYVCTTPDSSQRGGRQGKRNIHDLIR
jgi:hypothetical protein